MLGGVGTETDLVMPPPPGTLRGHRHLGRSKAQLFRWGEGGNQSFGKKLAGESVDGNAHHI